MVVTKVTDHIYLGDWQDARDIMKREYISYDVRSKIKILTCAFDSPYSKDFKFDIVDGPADNNESKFWYAVNKLIELRKNNEYVLVHCVSGRSRSVAVVIAYLMQVEHFTYAQACSRIISNGREIGIKPFFEKILLEIV